MHEATATCVAVFVVIAATGCQTSESLVSGSLGTHTATSIDALREIVAACESYLGALEALSDSNAGTTRDVWQARIRLAEARRELAARLGDREEELSQLRVIVKTGDQLIQEERLRQEIGQGNPLRLFDIEIHLIRARDQLRQVEEDTSLR